MISTNAKGGHYRDYYYGRYNSKDYDSMAAEYVSQREAKISKEKSEKMSAKDKETAKDLKKVAGEEKEGDDDDKKDDKKEGEDGDDGDKKEKKDEKKEEDADSKEEAKDDIPAELKKPEKPKALTQKKSKKHKKK